MTDDPATVFESFIAIQQGQIDRDVADGEREVDRLWRDVKASLSGRDDVPHERARSHHMQMVLARVLRSQADLSEAYSFHFASMSATNVAHEALDDAIGKGRLAELGRQMEEIEKREGLQRNEYWPIGAGPEDYQDLTNESEEWCQKIFDTVYTTILRRYRLGDIADLYENDRHRHDEIHERGRKQVFGNES